MPWISKATAALAMAASLLLAYLGVAYFTGSAPAFADVLQKMRQANTMVCDFVTTYTVEKGELPSALTQSPQRGTISMNFEGDTPAELIEYDERAPGQISRFLYLGDRAFVWAGGKVQAVTSAEAAQRRGTEDWLSRLLKMRESPDRQLGEATINGRRAIGFEIAGWKVGLGTRPPQGSPASTNRDSWLRAWVDVERDLPIRLEIEQRLDMPTATATIHQRWDNLKWNVALDAADFQPPPAEAVTTTTTIPAIDEAAFVDGMRAWVEWEGKARAGLDIMRQKERERGEKLPPGMLPLFEAADLDAGYPERLDGAWLVGAFSARATLAHLSETLPALKPLPKDLSDDERAKLASARSKDAAEASVQASSGAMLKAQVAAAFYQKLANEQRDAVYFGATVQPGDADAVLLKWRLDDGRYRVIYGDLHAATLESTD